MTAMNFLQSTKANLPERHTGKRHVGLADNRMHGEEKLIRYLDSTRESL
jgi:hypothetical protein